MTQDARAGSALSRNKLLVLLISLVLTLAGVFAAANFWRVSTVLKEASRETAAAGGIAFSVEQLADRRETGFQKVLGPADFRSAAAFEGKLFVCGRSSLIEIGPDGGRRREWSVGAELPPYPLVTISVRRGIGSPELWIATDGGGVLIYDGQLIKQLLPFAPGQRKISALLPLSNGRVLIGTQGAGLYVGDGKHLELLHPQFSHAEITALAGDEDEIWIGTRSQGVWMWRSGEALHYQTELPDAQVLSLFCNGQSTWVGTPMGVAEFQHGEFRRPLAEGVFAQSLIEHSGTLSIGTIDEGVVNVALQSHISQVGLEKGVESAREQNVISFAKVGADVLSVSSSGILRLSDGEAAVSSPEASLSNGHISALQVDHSGRLWIGYFDRGLDVVEQGSSLRVRHREDDVLFCVNRIKEDLQRGTVAVGAANGLVLFDSAAQPRETLNTQSGLLSNHVTDLIFENANGGSLAIATPAGISFVEHGTISSISAFQGLVNNHVYTLAERNGSLVAGTLGGFSLVRGGSIEGSYTTANSPLRQNWITASADAGDQTYLGTYGSGVIRVEKDSSISSFREFARERIEINPNALLLTSDAVYAGTAGEGLAVLPIGQERWRFVHVGLPSLNVTALASRNGTLFVGTDNGLVKVEERKLNP